jgi:maleate isomerase
MHYMARGHDAQPCFRFAVEVVVPDLFVFTPPLGTNLAFADVAPMGAFWLGKPLIAINTATYWHALRRNGIMERFEGFGALM